MYSVQIDYFPTKPISPVKTYRLYHIKKVKEFCSQDIVLTLTELAEKIKPHSGTTSERGLRVLNGQLRHVIEYLENTGYLRFLPDTDGELTFCNYKYYEELKLT